MARAILLEGLPAPFYEVQGYALLATCVTVRLYALEPVGSGVVIARD